MLHKYIPRKIEQKLKRVADRFPIVTLLGPRQSGKTTLLRQMFPTYQYFTLESPDTRILIKNDPRKFLDSVSSNPAIIDEIQLYPELTSYIQEYADTRFAMGQVLLTGSQQNLIHRSVAHTLVGRTALFYLLPFSLEEAPAKMLPQKIEDIIYHGFYPAIFDRNIPPADWYPSYYRTYLERDVRQISNIAKLDNFIMFVQLLARNSGQIINLNNIGRLAGIKQPTAKAWLSILEDSHVVFRLPAYHKNINKRIIKTPKIYFNDSGLLCYLLGIKKPEKISDHPLSGSIFESFVISEFIKANTYNEAGPNLYYFRDKEGHEVDLVLEKEMTIDLLEIKYSHTVHSGDFGNMDYFEKYAAVNSKTICYTGNQRLPGLMLWQELKSISTSPFYSGG